MQWAMVSSSEGVATAQSAPPSSSGDRRAPRSSSEDKPEGGYVVTCNLAQQADIEERRLFAAPEAPEPAAAEPAAPSRSSAPAAPEEALPRQEEEVHDPPVSVIRAELMRGHRPVVVSEVPVYIALKDHRNGRYFEDKGLCPHVRYRWMRGPVIKPCVYHPHKTSQFRDVTKTHQYYCSKECFLKGWYHLPRERWGNQDKDALEASQESQNEWVEVSQSRLYSPCPADIDRPLRLDIIPVMTDGRDFMHGAMSVTTGTVIPTPQEARTRRMICNHINLTAEWITKQFKVMNWNVLADLYASESVYPYCEKWALCWTWRKHLIMKELKSMAADIITLQEVQKDAYDEWFRPELQEVGYEGVYQQKKRDPIFHRGRYTAEGCATFYKTTRFKRADKLVVDYDKLSAGELRDLNTDDAAIGLQRLAKGNIALAVVLEDQVIKAPSNSQAAGANGGHLLCVVNTHILADPGYTDVKLWQAHLLLRSLENLPLKHAPMLVCGDFNSTPDSAVYEYMRQGSVRQNHADLQTDPCNLLQHFSVQHNLKVATAYETCNGREAEYTNFTEEFRGTLDYIWFTSDSLTVLAISQVDEEAQLTQETALPSSTRPSDHVSLVATFMFRGDYTPNTGAQAHHNPPPRRTGHHTGMNHASDPNPYHAGAGGCGPSMGGDPSVYMASNGAYGSAYPYHMRGGYHHPHAWS